MSKSNAAVTRAAAPLMSPEDVREYLNLQSVQTIYSWRTTGKGPRAIRVGRHLRYRRADVDAWLEQQADPIPAA